MVLSFWHSGPIREAACGKQLFTIDFALFFIFIGVELIYSIVLVAAVQPNESVIHTHISTLFQMLFSHRSLQSVEQSSLCYAIQQVLITVDFEWIQCPLNVTLVVRNSYFSIRSLIQFGFYLSNQNLFPSLSFVILCNSPRLCTKYCILYIALGNQPKLKAVQNCFFFPLNSDKWVCKRL